MRRWFWYWRCAAGLLKPLARRIPTSPRPHPLRIPGRWTTRSVTGAGLRSAAPSPHSNRAPLDVCPFPHPVFDFCQHHGHGHGHHAGHPRAVRGLRQGSNTSACVPHSHHALLCLRSLPASSCSRGPPRPTASSPSARSLPSPPSLPCHAHAFARPFAQVHLNAQGVRRQAKLQVPRGPVPAQEVCGGRRRVRRHQLLRGPQRAQAHRPDRVVLGAHAPPTTSLLPRSPIAHAEGRTMPPCSDRTGLNTTSRRSPRWLRAGRSAPGRATHTCVRSARPTG